MKRMGRFLLPLAMLAGLAGAAGTAQAQTDQIPTVLYEWTKPTQRENGDELKPEDIGGYELRVTPSGGEPQYVVIEDPAATSFDFTEHPTGDYTAVIAVYDTDGLYSDFVEITGKVNAIPPLPPTEFRSRQLPFASALEKCLVERLCRVYDPSPES